MPIRSVMTSYCLQLKSGKYLINDISGNIDLETWHHKCASKKKQNDTLSAVSIATLLAPVSFCQKNKKMLICNLYGGTKGPTWNRNSSHIVFSPIIRLGGVDSSCFKAKSGITVFINTAPAAKLLSWQQH